MKRIMWIAALAVLAFVAAAPATLAEDEGQALYDKKCSMCHGKDGVAKAMAKGSASFNDPEWQKATSVEDIVKVSLEGKGKMPKYEGKLTHEQLTSVAEYVKKLGS